MPNARNAGSYDDVRGVRQGVPAACQSRHGATCLPMGEPQGCARLRSGMHLLGRFAREVTMIYAALAFIVVLILERLFGGKR